MPCFYCEKGVLFGRTHTHHRGVAGGRWKKRAPKKQRLFEPNLQRVMIMQGKAEKRVKLCTKCLKRIKKDIRDGVKPFITLVSHTKIKETKKEVVKEPVKKTTKKATSK